MLLAPYFPVCLKGFFKYIWWLHDDSIRYVLARGGTFACDAHEISRHVSVIFGDGVGGQQVRKVLHLGFVTSFDLHRFLFGEQFVFGNEFVFGDVERI